MRNVLAMILMISASAPASATDAISGAPPAHAVGDVREYADRIAMVRCGRWEATELNSAGCLVV